MLGILVEALFTLLLFRRKNKIAAVVAITAVIGVMAIIAVVKGTY